MAKLGSWRKIPQWLAGIVCVASLAAALAVGGLAGLSAPETAKPILTGVLKETLLQSAAAQQFSQVQPYLSSLPPEDNLAIPGLPKLSITNGEAAGLGRDELAKLVAGELADKAYAGRFELPGEAAVDVAVFVPLGSVFSADAHRSISNLNIALWVLALLMGAVMTVFSSRFGRLAAPGFALVAGSAAPAVIYSILPGRLEALSGSGEASMQLQIMAPVFKSIVPVLEANQRLALLALLAGGALLVAAAVGGAFFPKQPSG